MGRGFVGIIIPDLRSPKLQDPRSIVLPVPSLDMHLIICQSEIDCGILDSRGSNRFIVLPQYFFLPSQFSSIPEPLIIIDYFLGQLKNRSDTFPVASNYLSS